MDEIHPARGDGADLFDDRVLFYLQNKSVIEKWAKLRHEASSATAQWLESLAGSINELRPEWTLWTGLAGKFTVALACPRLAIKPDHRPPAGIGLGWGAKVQPDLEGWDTGPFVGVCIDDSSDIAVALRLALDTRDVGSIQGYKSSTSWPRWRYVLMNGEWWRELDRYRADLLRGVSEFIKLYADVVEGVFELSQ